MQTSLLQSTRVVNKPRNVYQNDNYQPAMSLNDQEPARPTRRRKWDAISAGPRDVDAPPSEETSASAKPASVEPSANAARSDSVREFEINDHPGRRFAMMSANLKSVESHTGVVIVSKGRYYSPNEPAPSEEAPDAERKLFLKIKGTDETAVREAVAMLEGIMAQRSGSGAGEVERVWCDMDAGLAPEFELVTRLTGVDGEYLKYIEQESGAKVTISGRGSVGYVGRENLHLAIRADGLSKLGAAKSLAYSLIRTVQPVYKEHVGRHYGIRAWSGGRGRFGGGQGMQRSKWLGNAQLEPAGRQYARPAPGPPAVALSPPPPPPPGPPPPPPPGLPPPGPPPPPPPQ